MSCLICSLKNVALQNEIERRLDINAGFLTEDDKTAIANIVIGVLPTAEGVNV